MDYIDAMDKNISGLSRAAKDNALKKLINDSWLAHEVSACAAFLLLQRSSPPPSTLSLTPLQRRKLELGIRSQIGLRAYIEEQYGNLDEPVLIECVLCQEFVLKVRSAAKQRGRSGLTRGNRESAAPTSRARSACTPTAARSGLPPRPRAAAPPAQTRGRERRARHARHAREDLAEAAPRRKRGTQLFV